MMENFICMTCGVEFAARPAPPELCPICSDERQYVSPLGQRWTTLADLQAGHHNSLTPLEPGLTAISTDPKFGIGQRALLVQAPGGNVLWDCVSLVDEATVAAVRALGGITALAISHPHMFGSMVAWSQAFADAPVYLHASYREWVQRPDALIRYWDGDSLALDAGVTLYRCGGHFPGSTVLHWAEGAQGGGVLLSADTIHVAQDRRHVSFMYSYPNHIPLSAAVVKRIIARVEPLQFERIYSAFTDLEITTGARAAVLRSAERYTRMLAAE